MTLQGSHFHFSHSNCSSLQEFPLFQKVIRQHFSSLNNSPFNSLCCIFPLLTLPASWNRSCFQQECIFSNILNVSAQAILFQVSSKMSHRVTFNDDWGCNENARLARGNNWPTTRLPSVKLKQWHLEMLKLIYRNVHVHPPCSVYYDTMFMCWKVEEKANHYTLSSLDWTSTYWYLVIYVCVFGQYQKYQHQDFVRVQNY